MSARLRALLRSMSWLLVAWVILIVAAVAVPVFHVVLVVIVVIEEVGAFVGGRGTCADAVFGQRGGHLHAVTLGFRLGGQHLFPEGRYYMTESRLKLCIVVLHILVQVLWVTWWSPRILGPCPCCPSICGTWQRRPHSQERRCWVHSAVRSRSAKWSWEKTHIQYLQKISAYMQVFFFCSIHKKKPNMQLTFSFPRASGDCLSVFLNEHRFFCIAYLHANYRLPDGVK